LHPALRAHCFVFGARPTRTGSVAARSARLPALAAALRLILKTFIGKKLLLADRKNELAAAILAGQHFVFHAPTSNG
jgi:hypothetical protein